MKAVVGLFMCSFAVSAQIPEGDWKFVHPRAGFIAGIEWAKIAHSEFVSELKREFDGQTKAVRSEMDFIDDFGSALVSAPVPAQGQQPGEALIVLRGRFNLPKLRHSAAAQNARKQNYDGVEMYTAAKMTVAVLSDSLLLIGDRASVTGALRDRERTNPPSNNLILRAQKTAADAHIFVVANAGTAALKDIRSLSLAIAVRTRAELTASIEAADPAAAAALLSTVSPQALPLQVDIAGNTVTLSGSIGVPEIRAAAQQYTQAMLAKVMGMPPAFQAGARPARSVEAPLPPEKQVVKIYGLEEGVREVKLSPR